jgi:hypothetical protein
MNGPVRPQTMQTATPSTTSAALDTSAEHGSARVGNPIRPRED